jgi:hypothetical protein
MNNSGKQGNFSGSHWKRIMKATCCLFVMSLLPWISASSTPQIRHISRLPSEEFKSLWGIDTSFRWRPATFISLRGGADFVSGQETEAATKTEVLENIEEEKKEDFPQEKQSTTDKGDGKYAFSLYQPGDGSEQDPDKIPLRFLKMQKGNRAHAKQALETTLKWREEHDVDTILQRPHPTFDICKSITPHCFVGYDNTNHVVFFQRPALVHLDLARMNHVSNQDLVMHYVYVLEYCWNLLDPPVPVEGDEMDEHYHHKNTMTSIIDLTGLDFSIIRHRELVGFVKQFVQMMSSHYPQRSFKTLLLNAPSWFGMLYKLISPLLRESTKAKIEILSHGEHQVEVLKDLLGEECLKYLPAELLETDKKKHKTKDKKSLSEEAAAPISPLEQDFRNFACDRLAEAGMEMKPLINLKE